MRRHHARLVRSPDLRLTTRGAHSGSVARLLGAALTVAIALLPSVAWAQPGSLTEASALARAGHLAEAQEWLHLVHYNTAFFGGSGSEIERGSFFLAPHGNRDHEGELLATLDAFFAPQVPGQEDAHALCRFPARRAWLTSRLGLERALPVVHCPALDRALAEEVPTGVSLVYAANYVGNPASAFGHAFLYVRTRAGDQGPPDAAHRDHLDRGVEYRAVTKTKNPLAYGFQGIAGLFPGHVDDLPYDEQERRYTVEQGRDLWEYELALTPVELHVLALHLWELKAAQINYFYLTRNCAFEVMALLDVAAPRLGLMGRLKSIVFPIDTVKAVAEVPGLIARVAYRPSLETRLHARLNTLTTTEGVLARRLVLEPKLPWPADVPEARRAVILDAAIFEIDAHASTDLEGENETPTRQAWEALVLRRSGAALSEPTPKPDWDARPDFGHGTMRVALGTGVTSQYGSSFASMGYRLALHDLTDPPDGAPELSQVVILDTRLRYDWAQRHLTLDTLSFADVMALNPIAPAEPLASWRARAFGLRLHDKACPDCFAHGLDGSLGGTVATHDERVALFVMADAYVAFLPHDTGLANSFVRLGVGPYGGLRVRTGETVELLTGTFSYLPGGKLADTYDIRLTIKSTLARSIALGVELAAQPLSVEGQLTSFVYF